MEFEPVIGLETHVQLTTKTKIFCSSSTQYGHAPNELSDPLTMGFPGALPVLNKEVVQSAIMLGLATNCEIRRFNRFARKHYFYPDLPKGYQISQFDEPICERGHIKVYLDDETIRTVGITRIHMEEDAGKSMHDPRQAKSLVDLNRAGVPLLEVVTEPDIRTPAEASAFMKTLRQIVRYLGISDGNMEQGNLRCDANISVRPLGETRYGTRTEIKNINSFKFVERALEYELARQISLLKSGEEIVQETRLFDSENGSTHSMRSKEESSDYRYFPDPDLPPIVIEESWIREVQSELPILPEESRRQLSKDFGLSGYDVEVLTAESENVRYFHRVFDCCGNAKAASNWISSELFGQLNQAGLELSQSPVSADHLGELIKLIDSEVISGKMAKAVFQEMFETGKSASQIVEERGLKQVTDSEQIRKVVAEILEQNPKQLAAYLSGSEKVFGFFVGQAMKTSSGSFSPKVVNEVLKEELERAKGNK